MKYIGEALVNNVSVLNLNLYRNCMDVEGARAIAFMLTQNVNIQFLDIGHNCLRKKGLELIVDGMITNLQCKVQKLSIRSNFINYDGFNYFFDKIIFRTNVHLKEVYMKNNFLAEY